MTVPIVEAKELVKTYRMGQEIIHALAGVNLVVERGEFLSIMGRSGSGKSTLLNMIGCLDRPTRGEVWLEGLEVGSAKKSRLPAIRREKIGFVFQQQNLIPTLTALENVELPLRYAGVLAGRRRKRAVEMLEAVGLADRVRHRPGELSGGEQARVAIARALVNQPAIVLADEPTGEVDSHTAVIVIGLMKELNKRFQQTFVIVTHDPLVAEKTDRIIRLQDGLVVSDERRNGGGP